MKAMKNNLLLLLIAVLMPYIAYAQKDTREVNSQIVFDTPLNGPQHSSAVNYDKAKVDEISAQIRAARINGDVERAAQLQTELERVTGSKSTSAPLTNNAGLTSIVCNEPVSPGDYNLTIINGLDANWACATSTDRVTGRLYVVSAKYSSSVTASDTLKVFTSSNAGITWTLVNRIQSSAAYKWRNDELDIEAINKGDTSYVYAVVGYTNAGVSNSVLVRLNSSGGAFFASNLYTAVAGNNFIYPRITSDNGKYTNLSYVYVICTQDTALASGHTLRDKFAIITNPFAVTPTLTPRNNSSGGSYAWFYNGVPDTTMQYNDIAYSDSANTDFIVTVSNFYRSGGFNNLYLSYSANYGNTAPTNTPQITETKVNLKPRIGSTQLDAGGAQYMMIGYTRQFSASDWDPYYQRTSNNGVTWSGGYISSTTDSTLYTDLVSIPRVPNTFRMAYQVTLGGTGVLWTRSFNAGTFITAFSLATGMSTNYTPVRAGYRYDASDSCFTLGQGWPSSIGLFAYMGCTGTLTGIGNTELPGSYNLSQNYPNPFNPTTKISYAIPVTGYVSLNVYDMTGKLVSKLVNENKTAGNYIVDFSGVNLSSGTYFCKMESGSFSNVIKLMLIK